MNSRFHIKKECRSNIYSVMIHHMIFTCMRFINIILDLKSFFSVKTQPLCYSFKILSIFSNVGNIVLRCCSLPVTCTLLYNSFVLYTLLLINCCLCHIHCQLSLMSRSLSLFYNSVRDRVHCHYIVINVRDNVRDADCHINCH